jgi:hypothetical protein
MHNPDPPRANWWLACLAALLFAGCQKSLDLPAASATQPAKPQASTPVALAAPVAPSPPPLKRDGSHEFFEQGQIPQLKIVLAQEDMQRLRQDPRRYVVGKLIEDGKTTYKKVAVKLKGAAGSFRHLDDRPALTLNMNKEKKNQRFHDLDKFHLNNSVQDESYLSELLCSQLCLEAGLPTARTTHARVWINERDLGLYVLKEGYDKTFLARNFGDGSGNLYDGGFLRDIDQDLEKDEGENPDDRTDLKALLAACREGDANKRWQLMSDRLDVDQFLNFMALELMMCHWDGYIQNRNNYRIYFHPQSKKAIFLPHGMDQMFGDPNFAVFQHPGPIVPNAVMHNLEWKAKYRQRVKELLPLFAPAKLNAKIDAAHARLRPVLALIHGDRARQFDGRAQDWKNRLAQRAQIIREQMRNGPPEPLLFGKDGLVALAEDWHPAPNNADSKVEEVEIDGQPLLAIHTGPSNRTTASWRRKALLAQGTYRLEAKGRVTGVMATDDGTGTGLGLRISGGKRQNQLVGTTQWQPLAFEFDIQDAQREVELVLELRATAGKAWFDPSSIRLVKTK